MTATTQLNYAVDALGALAATSVYLDGTGASWLNVGEISDRLIKGGVQDADGFFLNASNYQFTTNSTYFGTWVSSCIAYVTEVNPGGFGECGNQYWNGGPANNWTGVAMSQYGEWSADAADPALNTAGVESRYDLDPRRRRALDALRDRHEPQRPGAVAVPRRHLSRARGLVQPARPRRRARPDHDGRRPAGRRAPVDQGARRVRRQVLPRHRRPARPGPRHRGPGRRPVVPRAGARARRPLQPAARAADLRRQGERHEVGKGFVAALAIQNTAPRRSIRGPSRAPSTATRR